MSGLPSIPISGDAAELVGSFGERIENRSLLLDKFVFHKQWPVVDSDRGPVKWNDASRWSLTRIADGGDRLLNREAEERKQRSRGRNVEPRNADRLKSEADLARRLANTKWDRGEAHGMQQLRQAHSRRLVALLQKSGRDRCRTIYARLEGRLAINLADGLIQNAGIALDRLFGLPYLPGSSVKGVCRHASLHELKKNGSPEMIRLFARVFGTSKNDFTARGELRDWAREISAEQHDQRGVVDFLPAHPLSDTRIVVDLTNVHYPDYYSSGRESDQAREKPQPNPFPAVEAGALFGFNLVLNSRGDHDALEAAVGWLVEALTIHGIGAKNAAGFGWFSIDEDADRIEQEEAKRRAQQKRDEQEEEDERKKKEAAESERIASLSPVELEMEKLSALDDEEFNKVARSLADETEARKTAFLELVKGEKKERWKFWKKKRQALAESIREVAGQLDIELP